MAAMPHLQAMGWDFAERLSHITRGTTEAYYNYDGSGQRVRKVIEKGNGIVETRLYLGGFEVFRKNVGGNLELERETLHIMDDTKRIALVETKTVDGGNAVNNPSPVMRYQLGNNIESAALELDENANIISYEEYYPYGDTSYRAGRNANEVSQKRYRYCNKEKDDENGLYYHGARYYASWLGRWISTDPAGLVDGANLYMYCRGNPVKLVDTNGTNSDNIDLGFKFPEGINTAEELKTYLSNKGTFEYEGTEYYLTSGSELNIEMVDGISRITGENLYVHEFQLAAEIKAVDEPEITDVISSKIFGKMSANKQFEYLENTVQKSKQMTNEQKGTLSNKLRGLRNSMRLEELFGDEKSRRFMNTDLRDLLNLNENGTMEYSFDDLVKSSEWEETMSIGASYHQNAVINPRYLNAKFTHKYDGREVVFNSNKQMVDLYPDK